MSDELDEYEEGVKRDEAEVAGIDEELAISDADQISDESSEQDETSFDETRHEYSGARKATATSTWRRWRRPAPCSTTPRRRRCSSARLTIVTAVTAGSDRAERRRSGVQFGVDARSRRGAGERLRRRLAARSAGSASGRCAVRVAAGLPLVGSDPAGELGRDASVRVIVRCGRVGRCLSMLRVGYRIRLSSGKGPDREGVVTAVIGSMLRVRWPSHEETTVIPAAGTLTVLASSGDDALSVVPPGKSAPKKGRGKKAAAKKAAPNTAAPRTAVAKATPKKAVAKAAPKKGRLREEEGRG